MKIIDAFTFLNEVELVKARLEYLNEYVTDFIIVESNQTWRHQRNEPFFESIIPTLPQDIQNKIHHVIAQWPDEWLEDPNGVQEKWVENGTREHAFYEMQKFASADDTVFMSDLDEFWDPEKLNDAITEYNKNGQLVWLHDNRVCFVDWETESLRQWPGTKMGTFKDIESMETFYCSKNKATRIDPGKHDKPLFYSFEGGWHFSKMGDEATKAKLMGSIREWRTWETKIGMTAEQAAREIFEGGGWNNVTKKKKIRAVPVGVKGLTEKIIPILSKYDILWSKGRLPDNGRGKRR
jgi:hypothetical protein